VRMLLWIGAIIAVVVGIYLLRSKINAPNAPLTSLPGTNIAHQNETQGTIAQEPAKTAVVPGASVITNTYQTNPDVKPAPSRAETR
jgi:hypothetical protein